MIILNTKIIKKDISIVKRDILALKRAGFNGAYLTDANFGAFEERAQGRQNSTHCVHQGRRFVA